ncbi:MAG: LutB/LldF family L-lactate oxidation iron-sulfur protein [Candidatus Thiodiazotropha sp.]
MNQSVEFHARIQQALDNAQGRQNFRSAMDGFRDKRAAQFPDEHCLCEQRALARTVRGNALRRLPDLLEQLEQNLERNGIRVHWAETPEEANRKVQELLKAQGATRVVKGKSMVTEEIGLNHHLEQNGFEVLESDLGEFIIQLAGETPSHIVVPAVHKNRHEIAALLHRYDPNIPLTDDVDRMTQEARRILREKFEQADAGISGVNFAVAETGTLCLVENEGNGRMCTAVPPLHIAITGIEKVVEKLSDVPHLLRLLPRSATGQPITTYFNMISAPRKPGEQDGPESVHLILLDNGRSRIHADETFRQTLQCIRCGACINHCPVYVQVGGHAYGTTYPGPIGCVLEPQRLGIDQIGTLASACTLCGACGEVCPVGIPLPKLINRIRAESVQGGADSPVRGAGSLRRGPEALVWKLWAGIHARPALYRLTTRLISRMSGLLPNRLGPWTRYRSAPRLATSTLHEWVKQQGYQGE